ETFDGRLKESGHELPLTFTVRTPTGGLHFYLYGPDLSEGVIGCRVGGFRNWGVDIRGEGGWVVGPGSPMPNGTRYEVVDGSEIAVAPEWDLELLEDAPHSSPAVPGEVEELTSESGLRRVETAAKGLEGLNGGSAFRSQLFGLSALVTAFYRADGKDDGAAYDEIVRLFEEHSVYDTPDDDDEKWITEGQNKAPEGMFVEEEDISFDP